MAHEIEVVDGVARTFYVGDAPWHGLGIPLVEPPTIEQAIVLAGLDWNVEARPLFMADGRPVAGQATVRLTDESILGVVGPDYTVLQNSEAFAFFQPFVEQKLVTLETAGSLRGGSRIWVLAKVVAPAGEVLPGDTVEQYVLLWNAHDGTLSAGAGFTRIRTVCANTLASAMNDQASRLIRVKHTKNIATAMGMVQAAMDIAAQEFTATIDQYKALAAKGCNTDDLEKYVKLVLAPPKAKGKAIVTTAEAEAEEAATCKRIMPKVVELFEAGRGTDIPGVRGTMWGAYNAVTEFLGYVRGNDQENRLESVWFGQGANLSKKALTLALAA